MLGEAVHFAVPGARTVLYCECESYAAAALVARMEDAALDCAPVWDNVGTLCCDEVLGYLQGFSPLIVTAGYPCQPFSLAGRRAGENDPRHLWPAIARFIAAANPALVFLENVPGHLTLGFERVVADLQGLGYSVAAGLFSAAECGASLKERARLFILASADCGQASGAGRQASGRIAPARPGCGMAGAKDADGGGELQAQGEECGRAGLEGSCCGLFPPAYDDWDGWERALAARPDLEPEICRTSLGMAARLDRCRGTLTGNGVVPLAAAYAFCALSAHFGDDGGVERRW